jgi:6-phosphogluconolactonase (cycloisomerase 2 family)
MKFGRLVLAVAAVAALAGALRADEQKTAPHPEFVYVTHRILGQAFVTALRMNPTNGALIPVPGSPFATTNFSWDVKIDPRNRFAFVTDSQTAVVQVLAIAPTTGALNPVAGSPFPMGFDPRTLVIHPTGRFLYSSELDFEIPARRVDPSTGALLPVPGSPFPGPLLSSGIAIDPTGRFLYTSELQTVSGSFDGSIWSYAIDPQTGALASIDTPVPTGLRTVDLAIVPSGHHLYAANGDTGDVSAFAIDPASGLLTAVPGSPFPAVLGLRSLAIVPDGRFVYALSKVGHVILTYARDEQTGALTALGAPLSTAAAPEHLALDCSGRFLYVSHGDPVNAVSVLRVDPATGGLTPAGGAPLGAATGFGITITTFGCAPSLTPVAR